VTGSRQGYDDSLPLLGLPMSVKDHFGEAHPLNQVAAWACSLCPVSKMYLKSSQQPLSRVSLDPVWRTPNHLA
jgi:hypothetical protein